MPTSCTGQAKLPATMPGIGLSAVFETTFGGDANSPPTDCVSKTTPAWNGMPIRE